MKKIKILSGAFGLFYLAFYLCIEVGCLLTCFFVDMEKALSYAVLIFWSIILGLGFLLFNRIVTIVTYDPKNEVVTRRGFFGGFHRELRVSNIIRTEVRMIPKEQEYLLLLDEEDNQCFDSLSPNMPIRVPNTAKGREFVAHFYIPER